MPDQNAPQLFETMKSALPPVEEPGYLAYWQDRLDNDPGDRDAERIGRILGGLNDLVLRGQKPTVELEFVRTEQPLKARMWYRSLGPLNPMTDVEPDMVRMAEVMYGRELSNPAESARLKLDSAYILSDLARAARQPAVQRDALRLAISTVREIKDRPDFADQEASYKLQSHILEGDLVQDALRLRFTGNLKPGPIPADKYWEYSKAFAAQELKSIAAFGKLVDERITDENFGNLLEWYYIAARRAQLWGDEAIDTVAVRGATSRENAEWKGEWDSQEEQRMDVTANHDIVVSSSQDDGRITTECIQLKTGPSNRRYHPRIKVINVEEVLNTRFTGLNQATDAMIRKLTVARNNYREGM